MIRVALIGCSKEKRPNEKGFAPARDLYASPLFRAALAHAEANFEHVFILSARYGLVPLDDVLADYDCPMSSLDKTDRAWWAHEVMCALWRRFVWENPVQSPPLELSVFAGADYAEPLTWQLPEFSNWTIMEPLAGLQVGQRLKWFAQRRAA